MPHKLEHYQEIAEEMVKRDEERDLMYEAMDEMWMSQWELPFKSDTWVHKVVSTDPHDAIRSGTRVLSAGDPRIKLTPLGVSADDRRNADQIERALYWHFLNASRRRRSDTIADFVLSALLYDEVAAQVMYIPWQIKEAKALGQDTRKLKAALRYGPFAVVVHSPRDVHVTYSDLMAEEVLLKTVMPVDEIVKFWGEKNTKGLIKDASNLKTNGGMPYATVYDYTDLDDRVVFAVLQERKDQPVNLNEGKPIKIFSAEHDLQFLPWAVKMGGTNIHDSGVAKRQPLLWSIYMSGQYNTQNLVETVVASEVISYALGPRLKVTGPTPNVEIDYGSPGRKAWVPPGHDIEQLNPPVIDSNLLVISERIGARIAKSTIPKVLQTGDVPSGTPFSALNLITQSGLKSLTPYKVLAEEGLADVFRKMLEWIDHSGEPAVAYVPRTALNGDTHTRQIEIKKGDFDPENIYLSVELTPDVPSDRMQRVQAGSVMKEQLNYPSRKVMESLGETDPGALVEERRTERKEDNVEAIELQSQQLVEMGKVQREEALKNAEIQLQIQAKQMQMQMQFQQAAQQQQQQAQGGGRQQDKSMAGRLRNKEVQQKASAQRGVAQGQGGSAASIQAEPGQGREQVTGQTRSGEEL